MAPSAVRMADAIEAISCTINFAVSFLVMVIQVINGSFSRRSAFVKAAKPSEYFVSLFKTPSSSPCRGRKVCWMFPCRGRKVCWRGGSNCPPPTGGARGGLFA